jgi:Outer membrane protein beta-barrel domain
MRNIFLAVILVTSFAVIATAQNSNKYEGFGGFSLSSVDTGLGGHVVGADDRETAPGFEGSATGYLTNHLGIEGDLDGHFKHKTFAFPTATGVSESLRSFNFLGGPHYRFASEGKVTIFTRALLGLNHSSLSNGTINSAAGPLVAGIGGSETDFAMKLGGGMDVGWTKRAAIRFSADYNPVFQKSDGNLNPEFGNRRTRNDLVFSVGVVVK